jgi:hypothetical protein
MVASWKVTYRLPGETTTETLDDVFDVRVTKQLKAEANGAELSLSNTNERFVTDGAPIFPEETTFKIYATESGSVTTSGTSDLLGTYILLNYELMPVEGKIKLILGDKTYNMLSRITVVRDSTRTAPELIENIVQQINEDGVTTTPITTDIASTRSDGTAFPTVNYSVVYENGYGAVDELSQPEYTGDDLPYIFWFDEEDTFHWQYPDQTVQATTLTYGKDPVITMKNERSESQSISMVIYNAGEDLDGNDRINFQLDPEASSVKNKISYQPMTDISGLVRQQVKEDFSLADTDNSTILGVLTNTEFIERLDTVAKARSFRIFDNVGKGLWQTTIEAIGQKYAINGLYEVKAPNTGFSKKNQRMQRIVHNFNKDGWNTRLELEQDPARVS